jgi:hypothetical protein
MLLRRKHFNIVVGKLDVRDELGSAVVIRGGKMLEFAVSTSGMRGGFRKF